MANELAQVAAGGEGTQPSVIEKNLGVSAS